MLSWSDPGPEKEKLNLAEILESQVTLYQARAEFQGIRLVLEPLPELKPVLGNRVNVEEVISNLISNALKYTENG
ncbi:MAG: HAMP domain-containing histidine kinase, partial [Deltaproteobacteria bacterium]|nr:HAMP domain-containing histidine kinase [Deltaproteobacteria bacterium]